MKGLLCIGVIRMDETDKLFIKMKKNRLINTLDSGLIKEAVQQYDLVDAFVEDVFRLYDGDKRKGLEDYIHKQNKLKDDIKVEGNKKADIDKIIVEKIEQYGKNALEMYEEIKKL